MKRLGQTYYFKSDPLASGNSNAIRWKRFRRMLARPKPDVCENSDLSRKAERVGIYYGSADY